MDELCSFIAKCLKGIVYLYIFAFAAHLFAMLVEVDDGRTPRKIGNYLRSHHILADFKKKED